MPLAGHRIEVKHTTSVNGVSENHDRRAPKVSYHNFHRHLKRRKKSSHDNFYHILDGRLKVWSTRLLHKLQIWANSEGYERRAPQLKHTKGLNLTKSECTKSKAQKSHFHMNK
jgi:hypothetical protein